jgi:long-subunit acyl-CoA synthetase (AMP-forming)
MLNTAFPDRRIVAHLGCEFFNSYGMTECCGKISMSLLPAHWPSRIQGLPEGQFDAQV